MKRWILCSATALFLLVGLAIGYRELHAADAHPPGEGAPKPGVVETDADEPVAYIKVAPIRKGSVARNILMYGSVIAAPGGLQTVSTSFECRIVHVLVNEGQKVARGDDLLRVQASPDTALQLDQARNAFKLQQETFQQVERRFNLKLATNELLLHAKQDMEQARLKLESMIKQGMDGERKMSSRLGGLIKKVYVQEGSIAPTGAPLVDIVAQNRLEILLGVGPENISELHLGQAVSLTRSNAPASREATGHVRKISYSVDPSTRMVDIFVSLASPAGFLLGEAINGKIVTGGEEGLIVPRSAVLPEEDHHVLYTVKDGRAVKHTVGILAENADEYQIVGKDLQVGEEAIVLGNYELTNGMKITTETERK